MLNKSTEAAIASMSRLAEAHCADEGILTAAQIAASRDLQKPFVAKLLTVLSGRGLIKGTPGPRGGYRIAHSPDEISLFDIASCFERTEAPFQCPFGPAYCGSGPQCPLHDDITRIRNATTEFLKKTTLEVFCRTPSR